MPPLRQPLYVPVRRRTRGRRWRRRRERICVARHQILVPMRPVQGLTAREEIGPVAGLDRHARRAAVLPTVVLSTLGVGKGALPSPIHALEVPPNQRLLRPYRTKSKHLQHLVHDDVFEQTAADQVGEVRRIEAHESDAREIASLAQQAGPATGDEPSYAIIR